MADSISYLFSHYLGYRDTPNLPEMSNRYDIESAIKCYNNKNYAQLDDRNKLAASSGFAITQYIPMYGELNLTGQEVAREFGFNVQDDGRLSLAIDEIEPIFPFLFEFLDKNDGIPIVRQMINTYKELNKDEQK